MTFFDKLALALLAWGAVVVVSSCWLATPPASREDAKLAEKLFLIGIALLALATLTWIFS